jgi:hypothetical protein
MKRSTAYRRVPKKRSLLRWLAFVFLTVVIGSVVAAGLALVVFYVELDR